jgi:hypothetical protein
MKKYGKTARRSRKRRGTSRLRAETAANTTRGRASRGCRSLLVKPGLGTKFGNGRSSVTNLHKGDVIMNGIIYLVGLIVIIMFILSFLGLR